jgi:hypothetical protein
MKKFIQTSIFLLIVQFAFGQSILLEPGASKRFAIKSTGATYGNFSTTNATGADLLFRLAETGDGSSGTLIGRIQTFSDRFQISSTGATIPITFLANTLERMRIEPDGKVGIGTLNPATRLHIHEPNAGSSGSFQLTNADAGATLSDGLHFGLNPSGLFSFGASIINKENSYLTLGTNGNTTQLFLDQSGNVAVGTLLAQDAKLLVEANSTCCGGTPYSTLTLKESEADGARLRFTNTNSLVASRFWDVFGFSAGSGADATATMSFYYGGTGGNVMALKGDGKVGIGTQSPSDLLHTNAASGSVYHRISATTGLSGLRLQNNTGDWSIYANEFSKLFIGFSTNDFVGNSNVLILEPSGSDYNFLPATTDQLNLGTATNRFKNIYLNNAPNVVSDRRLKTNITSVSYGIKDVMSLNPVKYNMKNGDGKLHLGFIAQEVEKVIPNVVNHHFLSNAELDEANKTGKTVEKDIYSMDYTGLIPVLVKAIQEQQQMIDDKSLKINQLEEKLKRMNDLEARLTAIEASLNKHTQEVKSEKK